MSSDNPYTIKTMLSKEDVREWVRNVEKNHSMKKTEDDELSNAATVDATRETEKGAQKVDEQTVEDDEYNRRRGLSKREFKKEFRISKNWKPDKTEYLSFKESIRILTQYLDLEMYKETYDDNATIMPDCCSEEIHENLDSVLLQLPTLMCRVRNNEELSTLIELAKKVKGVYTDNKDGFWYS